MSETKKSKKNYANIIAGRNLKYFMDELSIKNQELATNFGIEKESLQKILSGRNAISGPYNYILLDKYQCDLNFIYGGVAYSNKLIKEIEVVEATNSPKKIRESIVRQMHYLADLLEILDEKNDMI